MDDFDDELEERVVTFNEQLFSSSDDDEDSVPSSSSRKSAMQQHAMSGRNRYLDIHNELLSKYATNVMIYGPCGDRDLYTHPSSDWSRDIPLGPRATDMNQQSAFLQLPLDIRLIVYEHLFEDFTLCEYPLLGPAMHQPRIVRVYILHVEPLDCKTARFIACMCRYWYSCTFKTRC